MRKDRLVSALLGWLMFGFTLAFAQFNSNTVSPFGGEKGFAPSSPFGGAPVEEQYLIKNSFNKEFDLSKIGQFGREETMASFEKIWQQFRKTHQLANDGNFYETESPSTPDTIQAKAHFYVYVKSNSPEIIFLDKQRCPQCNGKGRYYSVSRMTDVDCDTCATKGTLANKYTYRLTHSGKLPEGIAKYLPAENKPAEDAGGQPQGPTGTTLSGLEKIADRHLNEICEKKFSDRSPKGFGVEKVWFSRDGNKLLLNLKFQNNEEIKVYAAKLRLELLSQGATYSSTSKLGKSQTLDVKFGKDSTVSLDYTNFYYPELDISTLPKNREESFAGLSAVLKIIKRTACVLVRIDSVSPKQAQDALDVEKTAFCFCEDSPPAASREPAGTSRPSPESRARVAYGSGMVFTKEGHIFTNHHVIENAARIYVVAFDNGQMVSKVEARIVKKDPRTDLAILQCNDWKPAAGAPSEPPPVVPSSQCKLGAEVFVLGYPLPGTVSSNVKYTKGDVSDLAGLDDDSSKIQHTAPIQPGNSGGPMALKDGRIVGVIVSSLSEGYALKKSGALPQGVNFSVKTDYLLTLCSIAGIELPKSTPSAEPVEHVRAYTVQIMSEK